MLEKLDDFWHQNNVDGRFQYVCACINALGVILNMIMQSWGMGIWCLCFFAFSYLIMYTNHIKYLKDNNLLEEASEENSDEDD